MSRIKRFFIENKLIFVAFMIPVLIVLMAFMVIGIYPFGDAQIAVIDMYHQYVPFLSELQYKLQEGGSLFYTWHGAGGSNFWNLMAYYGASPLNLLLAIFPKKLLMEGITLILLIKIGLAGSFMAIYLRYIGRRCDMVTVSFSTLYALCSYVMAYYWCIMWMDAVMLLPLCILGLNRVIDDGRAVMYVVSLALVVFSNYYMAIMVCIFIMFYYPALYFLKVKGGGVRRCVMTTAGAVGYSFLAIIMAAVMLLPTYISMQSTYYISSQMPDNWLIYNDALDVLNQLLPYTELTFREGLPNLYCGMIVVIMLAMYVLSRGISMREKAINGLFLLFMFFSLNLNKLDFLWHGLHFPNQLPFRYTFVICFVLIGIGYRMIQRRDNFEIKHMWMLLAVGTGYYLMAQKLMAGQEYSMELFFYGGMAWLVLYCAVIILYRKKYITSGSFSLLITVLIISEMAAGACTSFDRIGNSYREGYFANSSDIYKLTKSIDGEFARAEMDQLYTLNNPALYNYKGISQFSSSVNADTTAMMEKLGMDGSPGRNRFNYNQTAPVTNSILNIKYIITRNRQLEDTDFTLVDKSGHSGLYESKYPLSIGYMTGNEMRTWNTDSENPFHVLDDYLRAATSNEIDGVFVSAGEPQITSRNAEAEMTGDGRISVKSEGSGNSRVTMEYTAAATQKYYVFIEAHNAHRIMAKTGDKLDDMELRNDCGSVVNLGTIEEGQKFRIIVDYPKGKVGDITCHVNSMDYNLWEEAYGILSDEMLEVTDFGDTYIEGTVDVDESGVLFTSIPYDKGWSLKVDGVEKEINELTGGVFISVPLDEGSHQISLSFRPPGLLAGAAATVLAIIALVVISVIGKRRRAAGGSPWKRQELTDCASDLPETSEEKESPQEGADCNRI